MMMGFLIGRGRGLSVLPLSLTLGFSFPATFLAEAFEGVPLMSFDFAEAAVGVALAFGVTLSFEADFGVVPVLAFGLT